MPFVSSSGSLNDNWINQFVVTGQLIVVVVVVAVSPHAAAALALLAEPYVLECRVAFAQPDVV